MIHSAVSCMCTLLDNYYLSLSDYTTSYHQTITYYLLPATYYTYYLYILPVDYLLLIAFGSDVAHGWTRWG